jgi:hypothetical protein
MCVTNFNFRVWMWTGKSFRVSRKNVFSYFRSKVFTHDNDEDKEKEWWRCGGVHGFDVFVPFSFIWDEWIGVDITRHWLNVKQRSCQVMGSWWNFCRGIEERQTIRQMSGGWGWIFLVSFWGGLIERKDERGSRLNFWAPKEILRSSLRNVFRETWI